MATVSCHTAAASSDIAERPWKAASTNSTPKFNADEQYNEILAPECCNQDRTCTAAAVVGIYPQNRKEHPQIEGQSSTEPDTVLTMLSMYLAGGLLPRRNKSALAIGNKVVDADIGANRSPSSDGCYRSASFWQPDAPATEDCQKPECEHDGKQAT